MVTKAGIVPVRQTGQARELPPRPEGRRQDGDRPALSMACHDQACTANSPAEVLGRFVWPVSQRSTDRAHSRPS